MSKKKTEWVPAVIVPIAVAVLGLVGVVIAAFISSWGDNETDESAGQTSANHGPSSVQVVSFESREVPPPPQVELVFKGNAIEVLDQHYVFILVRLSDADNELAEHATTLSPNEHNYVVSPPAQ